MNEDFTLSELITEMKTKGMISVAPIKLVGRAKPSLDFLTIMADTDPAETDPDWWELRLYLRRN